MGNKPLCEHGDHSDGSRWCDGAREMLGNRLQLARIRLGADFETHGGKKVMYIGSPLNGGHRSFPPHGTIGTIESTFPRKEARPSVTAEWNYTPEVGASTLHAVSWEDVEILKTDDEGNILSGEVERASLRTAPRILALALPCPICLGKGLYIYSEHGYWQAWCASECSVGGPRISDSFPGLMAVAMWNIRGNPYALTKELRGFPKGDVQHSSAIEHRTLPKDPCPWCLGVEIRIWKDAGAKSYHGQCKGCGVFTPWWPGHPRDSVNSPLWPNRTDRSPDEVVEGWRRRRCTKDREIHRRRIL